MGEACSSKGEEESLRQGLSEKNTEGKRIFGKPRRRRKQYQPDLQKICLEGAEWFDLAQDMGKWLVVVNEVLIPVCWTTLVRCIYLNKALTIYQKQPYVYIYMYIVEQSFIGHCKCFQQADQSSACRCWVLKMQYTGRRVRLYSALNCNTIFPKTEQ